MPIQLQQYKAKMEYWRIKLFLNLALVPISILIPLVYHAYLWYIVKYHPHRTYISTNAPGQRAWINYILKDNEKKNVLAIQTIRNNIMGATLTATASILICCGVLTFASKAYGVDMTDDAFSLRSDGKELKADSKCAVVLLGFLAAFFCECVAVCCLTQVNVLINVVGVDGEEGGGARKETVVRLLEMGVFLSNVGNRLFFGTLPLMLWIFGPVLVFVCSAGAVAALYGVDVVRDGKGRVVELEVDDETIDV